MPEKLRVLDLFSGIGGFSLGLERTGGFETVAFCEIDPYCRAVLKKHWPDVPIFEDVRSLRGDEVRPIDLICGGYPCQPFSYAGKRQGKEDDRHLWPEVHRIVASVRPTWCLFENVAGHITMGLDQVLSDLEGEGYACQPLVVPACAVDAPHRRDRVWIVAHSTEQGLEGQRKSGKISETGGSGQHIAESRGVGNVSDTNLHDEQFLCGNELGEQKQPLTCDGGKILAHADRQRQQGPGQSVNAERSTAQRNRETVEPKHGCGPKFWKSEPNVGRVAHGVPRRVDRLRCLGNAVVPQIPEIIGRAILEAEGFSMSNTPQGEQPFDGGGE